MTEPSATAPVFAMQLNGGPVLVHLAIAFAWFVYNWLFRQGTTGQTVGKKALGIGIYRSGTTEPLGPGMTFVRQLAHVLDGLPCLIGYLSPLWDKEKRTFADMIIGSRAFKV